VIDASPLKIKRWEPKNFGGRRYGNVSLEQAFAQSINTAAVRLAAEVGIHQVVAAARDLGIDAPLPAVPNLALGTSEASLLDVPAPSPPCGPVAPSRNLSASPLSVRRTRVYGHWAHRREPERSCCIARI
jgi:cell division protein FtsI/penicillin-binding protein 2